MGSASFTAGPDISVGHFFVQDLHLDDNGIISHSLTGAKPTGARGNVCGAMSHRHSH